ncbi:MAG: ATP-binding protein [Salinivirgaceae bacterium]|nr:ATP-binding protein [Salinivirgaceae bacterium]MBR6081314.1 ATP-binding protein [Salinivirgaceae bacterium]
MSAYRPRIADQMLAARLRRKGAVLIEGPKWCGKTTTAEQQAASILYMADPMRKQQYLQAAKMNVRQLLTGEIPRLIDEWQIAPSLWDSVRFEVDHRGGWGHFILTGSSVPPSADEIFHSGTGRFAKLKMRTMSLFESGDSTGTVSLSDLFDAEKKTISGSSQIDINRLAYLICRGGWPGALDLNETDALAQAFDYYDVVCDSDISRVDDVQRDPQRVRLLLRSYARHQGTMATIGTILEDLKANESSSLSDNTVYDYIKALKKIFVIEDMPAWNPNIRSKTAIRTSDNHYFIDPSISTAALGASPDDLLNDLETMGLMFETLAVRDLRVYTDALDGQVFHYRDKKGLECDAVVHLRNGSYGLIEIKLGGDNLIDDGAKSLVKLAADIDTSRMKSPSFMMILTGVGDFPYQRDDGVLVVPIGCLKD